MHRFDSRSFDPARVLGLKGDRTISVCIPARNEARTVGAVVEQVLLAGHRSSAVADEVIVIDDGSHDGTGSVARRAGARVITVTPRGKGAAMQAGLEGSEGEIVLFLDADVENTGPHFVTSMVGPLLADPSVSLVKATYERSLDGRAGEGGRVTKLVAKPLIAHLFPELSSLEQPLSGECAGWRHVFEKVDFPVGYGVELATIIDVARVFGAETIAEVDLGTRIHRNRPWSELAPMATEVVEIALDRAAISS